MWKVYLAVMVALCFACTKDEIKHNDFAFGVNEPTGFLDRDTYARLCNESWRYGDDSNFVAIMDTVGKKVIVSVFALSLTGYDSVSYQDCIATGVAFKILQYGFKDHFTDKWDSKWEQVDLCMNVILDSTGKRYYTYKYSFWVWFRNMIDFL